MFYRNRSNKANKKLNSAKHEPRQKAKTQGEHADPGAIEHEKCSRRRTLAMHSDWEELCRNVNFNSRENSKIPFEDNMNLRESRKEAFRHN